jgi:hypothetical protein
MVNEAHASWWDRTLRAILASIRDLAAADWRDGPELLTGIEDVRSRPVRRIVLMGNA